MKFYLLNAKGDELVAETDAVEEAEKIVREWEKKGCSVRDKDGVLVEPKKAMVDEALILKPMGGG